MARFQYACRMRASFSARLGLAVLLTGGTLAAADISETPSAPVAPILSSNVGENSPKATPRIELLNRAPSPHPSPPMGEREKNSSTILGGGEEARMAAYPEITNVAQLQSFADAEPLRN